MTVVFPAGSGLTVKVLDGYDKTTQINDYRWVIEEDRTFYVDPNCQTNPPTRVARPPVSGSFRPSGRISTPATCRTWPRAAPGRYPAKPARPYQSGHWRACQCGVRCGQWRLPGRYHGNGFTAVIPPGPPGPDQALLHLHFAGRRGRPVHQWLRRNPDCGTRRHSGDLRPRHGRRSRSRPGQTAVTVLTQPSPYPPAKLSVFVFEDDFPLNGEQDGGGGVDVLGANEPGLGGFQLVPLGRHGRQRRFYRTDDLRHVQPAVDQQPGGNQGPGQGNDACPITQDAEAHRIEPDDPVDRSDATGITGMIVTCPKYEVRRHDLVPAGGPGGRLTT